MGLVTKKSLKDISIHSLVFEDLLTGGAYSCINRIRKVNCSTPRKTKVETRWAKSVLLTSFSLKETLYKN